MSNIEVSNLDAAGNLTSHAFRFYPCVKLRYSFQSIVEGPLGKLELHGINSAWALIDTGADFNLIKSSLIPAELAHIETIKTLWS